LGSIDRGAKVIFENKIKQINKSKFTKALFIDITCQTGSLNYSIEISNIIKKFRDENKNIPVYTFGEDQVTGPGIIILTSGDKVFANVNTVFGCYDFLWKGNEYASYLKERDLNIAFLHAGEHKVRMNPLEKLKEKDVEWLKNILNSNKSILINAVYENRKKNIINKENFEKFFNSNVYLAKNALENNLIDSLGILDSVALKDFQGYEMKKQNVKISIQDLLAKGNVRSILGGVVEGEILEMGDPFETNFESIGNLDTENILKIKLLL